MKLILTTLAALAIGAGSLKAGDTRIYNDPILAAQMDEQRALWAKMEEALEQHKSEDEIIHVRIRRTANDLELRISELESKVESLEADR
jgi:hypothetical protein